MKRLLALLVLICVATSAPAAIRYFDSSDSLGDFRTNYNSAVSQLYALATSGSGAFNTNMLENLANVDAVASPTVNNVLIWNGTAWSNKAVAGTGDFLADGTVPMSGNLNGGANSFTNFKLTAENAGTNVTITGDGKINAAAADLSALSNNVASKVTSTNAFTPTWISQDAGGTVTLYRAGINYFSASRTNPITITFATNDWGTDRMTVALDLLAGTGSVTWLAATVANTGTASSTNLGTLSTTATVPLLLDKTSGNLFPARVYNLAK